MRIELVNLDELPVADDPRWHDWLSTGELARCAEFDRVEEHLAARLAGKRALGRELGLDWRRLEFLHQPHQPPYVLLDGEILAGAGVSLSHAGGYAAALAWSR